MGEQTVHTHVSGNIVPCTLTVVRCDFRFKLWLYELVRISPYRNDTSKLFLPLATGSLALQSAGFKGLGIT